MPDTITRLSLIHCPSQAPGFTLTNIAEGLDLGENEQLPAAEKQQRIQEKLAVININEKIRQLEAMRVNLLRGIDEVLANCPD